MAEELETITFKAPKSFSDRLAKEAYDLDVPKSTLICCAIMLGSPVIKDKPYLISIIERNGFKKQ